MGKKTPDQWFAEYGECHQNRTNKKIHWICVPMIAASLLALLWDIPTPAFMHQVPYLNWSTVVVSVSLIYYFRLSMTLAIGMLAFSIAVIAMIIAFQRLNVMPVWQFALVLFAAAWVGQAIGHSIEGKKPSFFTDLTFLLIGPIWLLSSVYRRLGIPY
ncbi:Mpo1 family 2-hydroxy fatty acid dioxygenase [Schlesneria paludicola]|uniref:Mpo1 family 2-hydroxy fatty acid dioxygenase n=1 Tax=Schlesneria paludicola TaxID=360056 RepID=UPI000492DBF7|nr:Mpo1-like protein [Schlesneria paludicola]